LLQGRPWIVAGRVGLEQRGNGVDVVLPRQRERAPTVAAAHQPGGSARRDPAVWREPEQRGPTGEEFRGVDRNAGELTELVSRPPRPRQHGDGNGQHASIVRFRRGYGR
jgi:hypothetical protein